MAALTDEDLRAAVDERGVLRPGALSPPSRDGALTVFAQRTDATLEALVWEQHASRFFSARVGLAVDKRAAFDDPPALDAARVVVAPNGAAPGTRFCFARPRTDDDLHAAEVADARAGSPGLGLLARRCGYVWLVATEVEGADDDALALLLAAIIASVVLGPILTPSGKALMGPKSARLALERLARKAAPQ